MLLTQQAADPVTEGQEALKAGPDYPWYDPGSDGVRRIDVETPRDFWPDWDPSWIFGAWMGWLALALVVVVLVAILYALVKAYLRREAGALQFQMADRKRQAGDRARIEALPFAVARDTTDLLGAAEKAYRDGNYGEAAIFLYSHLLVELDRNQHIRLTKGKTNRQYLRELRDRRPMQGLVEHAMTLFEEVFFGKHTLEKSRFEKCWSRLGEFQRLLVQVA